MKTYCYLFILLSFVFTACQALVDAPVPNLQWPLFDAATSSPLSSQQRKSLEGIYAIGDAADDFGKEAALKWTYAVTNKKDTTYYLSFFCAEDVRYFICQGKKSDSQILVNGYWRNIENTKTGKAHFTMPVSKLRQTIEKASTLQIEGLYGMGNEEPHKKISFRYLRPLYTKTPYYIIAHRGGGRNNDLLPASENSLEIIPLASQLGANGIEIDVQLTKDHIPVLFHDANLNDRLTTKTGISGNIDTYSWQELQEKVNLKRGGKIPSLEEALEMVVDKTPLELVWLDCKYKEGLPTIYALQKKFMNKAKSRGRTLLIAIGLPDNDVLNGFMQLPNYNAIPSICELDTAKAAKAGANFWAPSWIKGHQNKIVEAVQATGKKAIVWTIDIPNKIKEFLYEAKFNGMITNRPTMAAYYYYARK